MTDILLHTSDQNPCLHCDYYDNDIKSCKICGTCQLCGGFIDEEGEENDF